MTIYLFDFDDTITRLPYEDSLTYMMKEESLDPTFDFKLIKRTKKDYDDAVKNNDGPIFLLSNRISELEEPLKRILTKFGYKFDGYYLIDSDDRHKGNRIKKILKKYPGCTTIKYWEDKDKWIDAVTETLKEYPDIKLEITKTI
jgi:phosphatidate phosphatase APP1